MSDKSIRSPLPSLITYHSSLITRTYEDRNRALELRRAVDASRREAVPLPPLLEPFGARRRSDPVPPGAGLRHRAAEGAFVRSVVPLHRRRLAAVDVDGGAGRRVAPPSEDGRGLRRRPCGRL